MSKVASARLKLEYFSVPQIIPHPTNSRLHSEQQVQQIAQSIKVFGFGAPILLDKDNHIIAGHGRLRAAKSLKLKEIPVVRLEHLTEVQAEALRIADNKLTENASWDQNLLAQNFKVLADFELDFPLEITGFETAEIDLFIDSLNITTNEDEEQLAEFFEDGLPITKPGDLWHLGKHRLLCANALDASSFAELMQRKKASLVFTDPPYNVPIDGHVGGSGSIKHREFAMASGEMTKAQFTDFLSTVCERLIENSVDGSIHFIFMDWRHMQELLDAGLRHFKELKNLCVWVKDNGGMGSFYRSKHELVFVFKQGGAPHQNHFKLGQHGRCRTNVWEYAGVNSFARTQGGEDVLKLHPTVKPVQMAVDAILDCSKRSQIVLDPFLGSGTTLLAADRIGRKCYGMELDPLYVDTAIRRWQKSSGEVAVRASDGQQFGKLSAESNNEKA